MSSDKKVEDAAKEKSDKEKLRKEKAELKDIDRYLIRKYAGAIRKAPVHFTKEKTVEEVNYEPSPSSDADGKEQNEANIENKKNTKTTKTIERDRLDHYEKLYWCYVGSYNAKTKRITTIATIIAVAAVMIATIFCCAFGPNFKSQETVNTSSNNTMVVSGYLDHGSYGYTYLRESNNGR